VFSKLLKRLRTVINAFIETIKMTQFDIFWSCASLKSKEGRRILIRCIKAFPENLRYRLDKDADFTPLKVTNEWSKVGKYKTKSFGEVDFSNIAEIFGVIIRHNKHRIELNFSGGNINKKIIDTCLHTVNNYFEINSSVKKAMLSAFEGNKSLHGFFKYCYSLFPRYESVGIFGTGEFKTVNLENVVKKLKYPDIWFTVENDNLTISFWYHFNSASTRAKANALVVTMNEQFDIMNFEHCEHLIS
jgi:hypothetical protein